MSSPIDHCLSRLNEGSREIESYAKAVLNVNGSPVEINFWRLKTEDLLRKLASAAKTLDNSPSPPTINPAPELWWNDLKDAAQALTQSCCKLWQQSLEAAPGMDPFNERATRSSSFDEFCEGAFANLRLGIEEVQESRHTLAMLECQSPLPQTKKARPDGNSLTKTEASGLPLQRGQADSKADKTKKKTKRLPADPKVIKLANLLTKEGNKDRSMNEVALEFAENYKALADSLLQQVRRHREALLPQKPGK